MSNPPTIGYGLISVIGRRRTMEDAFTVLPNFVYNEHDEKTESEDDERKRYDFFAVFDGHGSRKVSHKCKERLHHIVAEELIGFEGGVVDWQSVITTSLARMDAEVAVGETGGRGDVAKAMGSAALVVVIVGNKEVVVANCGDCKVVGFRNGDSVQLSRDHKPVRQSEEDRGEASGVEAEVKVCKRNGSDDFLVIGTNGLWDVMPNEMAGDLVRKCFGGQVSKTVMEGAGGNCSAAAATMLAELAIARGSCDNISVIVVQLRSYDADSSSFTK